MENTYKLWGAKCVKQNLIHSSHCTLLPAPPDSGSLFLRPSPSWPEITPLLIYSILITLAIDATFSQMTLVKTVPSPKPESRAKGGLGMHWRPGGHSTTLLLWSPCHLCWHPWQPEHLCFLGDYSTWLRSSPECPLPSVLVSSSSDVSFLKFFPLCLKIPVPLSGEEVFDIFAKANPVLSCLFWHLMLSALSFHTWFQRLKMLPIHLQAPGHLAPARCLLVNSSRHLSAFPTLSVQAMLLVTLLSETNPWLPSLYVFPLWQFSLCLFSLCHHPFLQFNGICPLPCHGNPTHRV